MEQPSVTAVHDAPPVEVTEITEDKPVLSFAKWLEKHARGSLNDEASAAMAELVKAVSDRGKGGTLTLTIKVEPTGQSGRMVAAGGKVDTKAPQPPAELGIFYVGEGGSLHREDPYQQRIPGMNVTTTEPVRRIESDDAPVRVVE